MNFIITHSYIFLAICLGIISQLIIKWRMSLVGQLPDNVFEKLKILLFALIDPFIIFSVLLTFIAGISWLAAMTKFEISYAYPFISLSFVLILIFSSIFFSEPISVNKIFGIIFIVIGIIISSR